MVSILSSLRRGALVRIFPSRQRGRSYTRVFRSKWFMFYNGYMKRASAGSERRGAVHVA